jgi:hypothetical protein
LVLLGLATRQESGIEMIENPIVVVVTKEEIENFRALLQKHVGLMAKIWQLRCNVKKMSHVESIEVKYPPGLPLLEWFQRNSENDEDRTFLFKNLNDSSVGSFFKKWNVEFEAAIKKVKIKREHEDTMIAKDDGMAPSWRFCSFYCNSHALLCFICEGGPTREFLSIVWKQIGDLKVDIGTESIGLFVLYGKFWIPRALENNRRLPDKALVYYRAIGRIFAYCISHGEAIAHHIMVCV